MAFAMPGVLRQARRLRQILRPAQRRFARTPARRPRAPSLRAPPDERRSRQGSCSERSGEGPFLRTGRRTGHPLSRGIETRARRPAQYPDHPGTGQKALQYPHLAAPACGRFAATRRWSARKPPTPKAPSSPRSSSLLEPIIAEGHKVLVFSQFIQMLDIIRAGDRAAGEWPHFLLTGDTEDRGPLRPELPAKRRRRRLPSFPCAPHAASGLNLTAASYVVLYDPLVESGRRKPGHRSYASHRPDEPGHRLPAARKGKHRRKNPQAPAAARAPSPKTSSGEESFTRALTLDDFRFLPCSANSVARTAEFRPD